MGSKQIKTNVSLTNQKVITVQGKTFTRALIVFGFFVFFGKWWRWPEICTQIVVVLQVITYASVRAYHRLFHKLSWLSIILGNLHEIWLMSWGDNFWVVSAIHRLSSTILSKTSFFFFFDTPKEAGVKNHTDWTDYT